MAFISKKHLPYKNQNLQYIVVLQLGLNLIVVKGRSTQEEYVFESENVEIKFTREYNLTTYEF